MPLISEKTFAITMLSSVAASALTLPFVLIMHFLMPRAVLERYWKAPYFRPAELALFTNTIYSPMRTIMLTWAVAYPHFGRKRNITEAHLLVPRWYRVLCKLLGIWILWWAALLLLHGVGFFIYYQAIGRPIAWTR